MTNTLTMTIGLPGSGKSTWAKEQIAKEAPGRTVRVNKDCLRYMLNADRRGGKSERTVLWGRDALVGTLLRGGLNVIVDDTNFNPIHERALRTLADENSARFVIKDFRDVPLRVCIERDRNRPNSVGSTVIRKMWREYLKPKIEAPLWMPGVEQVLIVDIDGTVAKNLGARGFFEWAKVGLDVPNQPVIDMIETLHFKAGFGLRFVSGRDEVCREETRVWLTRHMGQYTTDYPLFMRPQGSNEDDTVIKKRIYDDNIAGQVNVGYVFEDRDKVVEMWRGLGLTVLQVDEGDF